jgi:hypothetical protein
MKAKKIKYKHGKYISRLPNIAARDGFADLVAQ